MARRSVPLPTLLRRRGTDEYVPPPPGPVERRAAARARHVVGDRAHRRRVDPRALAQSRSATAVALRSLDTEAGGGFFHVPEDAEQSDAAAAEVFDDPAGPPVVDAQTHLVNPRRFHGEAARALSWYLGFADADRWSAGVDAELLGPAMWADLVFGRSETATALITLPPGVGEGRVVDNDEVASCRAIVDSLAGPGRVLTHSIVHPDAAGELESMPAWRERCRPAGWKCYPLFGPDGGWRLDDEIGTTFLHQVRELGPPIVAVHKGISGPVPDVAATGASPADVGPAAVAFPEVTFLVYHSGYEPGWEEGAFRHGGHGVDTLLTSLDDHGIGVDGNVHAELGSTWHLILRRPEEAAHLIGKLLTTVGEDRIVWGTDSVWYGSPQPLIDAFRRFRIPTWMQDEFGYPPLTPAVVAKILSTNAARVYGIDPTPRTDDWIPRARDELRRAFPATIAASGDVAESG